MILSYVLAALVGGILVILGINLGYSIGYNYLLKLQKELDVIRELPCSDPHKRKTSEYYIIGREQSNGGNT